MGVSLTLRLPSFSLHLQAHLGDIVVLVPDHHNKAYITIK